MRNGNWGDNWGGASSWWMPVMMMAFVIAFAIVVATLVHYAPHTHHQHLPAGQHLPSGGALTPARSTPQEILAERLARGEIEPDEYHQRLTALGNDAAPRP